MAIKQDKAPTTTEEIILFLQSQLQKNKQTNQGGVQIVEEK